MSFHFSPHLRRLVGWKRGTTESHIHIDRYYIDLYIDLTGYLNLRQCQMLFHEWVCIILVPKNRIAGMNDFPPSNLYYLFSIYIAWSNFSSFQHLVLFTHTCKQQEWNQCLCLHLECVRWYSINCCQHVSIDITTLCTVSSNPSPAQCAVLANDCYYGLQAIIQWITFSGNVWRFSKHGFVVADNNNMTD